MSTAVVVRTPVPPAPAMPNFALTPMLEEHRATLAPFLPPGVEIERVAAELFLATQKNPDLLKLSATKLVPALGRAIATGGVIGEDVYIVPYGSDVQVVIDYKYKAQCIVRAGGARAIKARAVYANEPFEIHYGTEERIEHQPLAPSERGELRGAYAIAVVNAWTRIIEWMELSDIEEIRRKSKSWSKGKCPAWYAKKTVINQIAKLLPRSARLTHVQAMIAAEEREEFGAALPAWERRPATARAAVDVGGDDEFPVAGVVSDEEAQPRHIVGAGSAREEIPASLLAEARACRIPGTKEQMRGYGGQTLGRVPTNALQFIVEWAMSPDTKHSRAPELKRYALLLLREKGIVLEEDEQLPGVERSEAGLEGASDASREFVDEAGSPAAAATAEGTRPSTPFASPLDAPPPPPIATDPRLEPGSIGAMLPGEAEDMARAAGELPLDDTRPPRRPRTGIPD